MQLSRIISLLNPWWVKETKAKETKEKKIEKGIINEELFVYDLLSSWRLQIVRHLLQITCPKFDKLISTYGEPNIST